VDHRLIRLGILVSSVRKNISKEIPLQQLALLLLVAQAGDERITVSDASRMLDMGQTSVSKNAKMLSRYAEKRGGQMEIKGYALIDARPDLWERRRLRMTITPKGIDVLEKIMKEVA